MKTTRPRQRFRTAAQIIAAVPPPRKRWVSFREWWRDWGLGFANTAGVIAQVVAVGVGVYTFKYTLVPLYKQASLEDTQVRITAEVEGLKKEKDQQNSALSRASQELADTKKGLAESSVALEEQNAALSRATLELANAKSDLSRSLVALSEGEKRVQEVKAQATVALATSAQAQLIAATAVAAAASAVADREKAYAVMRTSIFESMVSEIGSCERSYSGGPTSRPLERDRCFETTGDERYLKLLRPVDSENLRAARVLAGKEWLKVIPELRAPLEQQLATAEAALNDFQRRDVKGSLEAQQVRSKLGRQLDDVHDKFHDFTNTIGPRIQYLLFDALRTVEAQRRP